MPAPPGRVFFLCTLGFDARFQLDGIVSLQQVPSFVLLLSTEVFARQQPRTRRGSSAFMVTIHFAISLPLFAQQAALRPIQVVPQTSLTHGFIEGTQLNLGFVGFEVRDEMGV